MAILKPFGSSIDDVDHHLAETEVKKIREWEAFRAGTGPQPNTNQRWPEPLIRGTSIDDVDHRLVEPEVQVIRDWERYRTDRAVRSDPPKTSHWSWSRPPAPRLENASPKEELSLDLARKVLDNTMRDQPHAQETMILTLFKMGLNPHEIARSPLGKAFSSRPDFEVAVRKSPDLIRIFWGGNVGAIIGLEKEKPKRPFRRPI